MYVESPVYITYTPRTVDLLLPFLKSLLDCSTCHYALVDNACLPAEKKLLQHAANLSERVTYCSIPFWKTVRQGTVSDHLVGQLKTPQFRMMDSEIFASEPFDQSLEESLRHNKAVYSARPLWCSEDDETLFDDPNMGGHYATTDQGQVLGTTHLAWYDAVALKDSLKQTGFRMERRKWTDLSESQQSTLQALGLEKAVYDTGKLANLSLLASDHGLSFCHLPQLHHVGGISIYQASELKPAGERALRRYTSILPAGGLRTAANTIARLIYQADLDDDRQDELTKEQVQRSDMLVEKRNQVRRYFSKALSRMIAGGEPDEPPTLGVPELDERIERAAVFLAQNYGDWRREMVGP